MGFNSGFKGLKVSRYLDIRDNIQITRTDLACTHCVNTLSNDKYSCFVSADISLFCRCLL